MLLQNATRTLLFVEAVALQAEQNSIQSYCLKNLLLKASDPLVLVAVTVLTGTGAGSGAVSLQFNLRLLLPILPDPYATNLQFSTDSTGSAATLGTMTVVLRWLATQPPVIDVLLPTGVLQGLVPASPSAAPSTTAPQRDSGAPGRRRGQ